MFYQPYGSSGCLHLIVAHKFVFFSVYDWKVNSWKTEFTSWRQNGGRFPMWYSSKYSDHGWVLWENSEYKLEYWDIFLVQSGFLSFCTDCPPVLFEVTCTDNSFQVGGFPWHYIYTPTHKTHKGTYHICSLKDSTLVGLTIPLYIQYTISVVIWPFGYKLQHVLMMMDKCP